MTTRPKKPKVEPSISFPFSGGALALPVSELELRSLKQHVAMFASADLQVKAIGNTGLHRAADSVVSAKLAQANRKLISKKPRAKSRWKEAILRAMADRTEGQEFKAFMQRWELGPIEGFRIVADGDNYTVTDENSDLGSTSYTCGSLRKIYSELK